MAVPAQAQDFRGVSIGDPTSSLAVLGEPTEILVSDAGLTLRQYPPRLGHFLTVGVDTTNHVRLLRSYSDPQSRSQSDRNGLLSVTATLSDITQHISDFGADAVPVDLIVPFPEMLATGLIFDLEDNPETVVVLTFIQNTFFMTDADVASELGTVDLSLDAPLLGVDLIDRLHFAGHPEVYGRALRERTEQIYFPLPFAEAFPHYMPE
ncbi:hypothetical protein Jann_1894 [Jannaschia sp. CCS1]|nr:hypothetical protein Jann_1894 [Jannaschia sp. CCS1]